MSDYSCISVMIDDMQYRWDMEQDIAVLGRTSNQSELVWCGSLLPSFYLQCGDAKVYTDGYVTNVEETSVNRYEISVAYSQMGHGSLSFAVEPWGIRICNLMIQWYKETAIISMYFGTKLLTESQRQMAPSLEEPFWPNWKSEGYCIPCAMGGNAGWASFGPGDIPSAALSLRLKAATACLEYLYREDLWSPSDPHHRLWGEPLRITWGSSAYEAFEPLFQTFPRNESKSHSHAKSFVCTWGDFKEGRFHLRSLTDRAADKTPADMVILDDYWETFNGSGTPNTALFPTFDEDLEYMKSKGFEIAFWQSIGWIDNPEAVGLLDEDLLCGSDGKPRLWQWSGDPVYQRARHYCIDPSSSRAREFLVNRTQQIVRRYKPTAFKLDFGYSMPGPDVCVPRNPEFRGERLCSELLKIITQAAKELNPNITIIYYGIHPLLHHHFDMINLDDLGDAGDSAEYERIGHSQRCMWAALAAGHGMSINTSTGYYWATLEDILLDTAVVGVHGLTLGQKDRTGRTITDRQQCRWWAIRQWHRHSCGWKPLWLDADMGGMGSEPMIQSWGRLEQIRGKQIRTALALRDGSARERVGQELNFLQYEGNWALIAQDDKDLSESTRFACIPFTYGSLKFGCEYHHIHVFCLVDNAVVKTRTYLRSEHESATLRVDDDELNYVVGFVVER